MYAFCLFAVEQSVTYKCRLLYGDINLTGARYHQKDISRGIKMTRTEEGERANRMVKQLELPKIGFS